ncbi:hypothetical protein CFC21_092962 [Triticum aestivum]|nr:uncharacterized protein LOC109769373 [Aegilops tauschii subsp. strangulata]XP_044420130.1 uncharacterized protein LOC123144926 [Triticum aestivum]KAF7090160.1 hypothetical protein CFC21_092962 [Triticum aestivum]
MSAGGTIMNKTVEDAIILIESIGFHQMQWGYERPSSNPKVASRLQSEAVCSISEQKSSMVPNIQNQHVSFRGQQHFRTELDPPYRKIDLTSIILDDDYDIFQDDATIVDQMETIVADPIPHGNETVQNESKLQDVYEEPTLIDAKLRQQDMEKFTCVSQLCDWWNLVVSPIAHTCVTTVSGLFVKKKSLAPPVVASITVKESISEKNSEDEIPTPAHTTKQVGDIPRREIQEDESNLEELILQCPEKIPRVAELHDWWKSSVSLLKLSSDGDEENIAQKDSEVVISAPLPEHVSAYSQMGTLQTQLGVAGSSTIEYPQEERPQLEEDLQVDEEQDDEELDYPSDEVEDIISISPKEVQEAAVDELEEPEMHLPIVIQERDVAGLSNPLDDMCPYDFFASTFHYMIPSLKLDLKNGLLGHDHTYPVIGISLIYDDTYSPHARPMLNDKYHPYASIELTDFYHPKHVLYSYAYVIGYSIDDLEGIIPTTCIVSFVESSFRFLLVHDPLQADKVRGDIPWDPGGLRAW